METPEQASMMSISELKTLLKAEHKLLLIDTLPRTRYQQKHLPEAVNVCVFEIDFLDQITTITTDKEQPIVVYGANQKTHDAKTAAAKLLRAGYSQVTVLSGGLAAWLAAGNLLTGDSVVETELPKDQLADGSYLVDTEASVIEWSGRNPNSTHRGTLRLSSGEMQISGGQLKGVFVLDMNSIENLNLAGDPLKSVLEGHLKSDDFFFVKQFPNARFEMEATPTADAQSASVPNYAVAGHLKLCGISAEQNFSATILPTGDGKFVAEAHFDMDRTRWGVIYGSTNFFEHLGMHLVFNHISLQLRIMTK